MFVEWLPPVFKYCRMCFVLYFLHHYFRLNVLVCEKILSGWGDTESLVLKLISADMSTTGMPLKLRQLNRTWNTARRN